MSSNMTRILSAWGLSAGLACAQVAAGGFEDIEVHGFASQGFVKTSANNFFGDSGHGSFDFTELGINVTSEPWDKVRLSGQLLSRHAGDMYSGSPSVDFALADVTLRSTESGSLGLMAGRLKNPLGLYNESRDVPFTRPSIFVPQEVYYDKVRNLIHSSDGLAARMAWYGDAANLSLYFAAAQPVLDENIEYSYLGGGFVGDFEPDGVSYVGRVLLETPDDRLRAALSIASTSVRFEPGAGDWIGNGDIDLLFGIASLQYSMGDWTLTTEYMREPTEWHGFSGSAFGGMKSTAEGYYLQAAWQANDDTELMMRYGESYADRGDRSGQGLSQVTGGLFPAHTWYSRILTVGVRWDITSEFMLRAEYQRHEGSFVLSVRENTVPQDMEPDWDMFAVSASYRF